MIQVPSIYTWVPCILIRRNEQQDIGAASALLNLRKLFICYCSIIETEDGHDHD